MRLLTGRQLIWLLGLVGPCVALAALFVGSTNISPLVIFYIQANAQDWIILQEIRLPRVLLSMLAGIVLAMSGAVLQGLFRNPLADPSLIGASAGASTGASLAILLGSTLTIGSGLAGLSVVAMGAFIGSSLAVWLVYRLSAGPRGTSVSTMLLVGIAISALAAALNNLMGFVADNEMLRRMSLWQMGNLDLADWNRVKLGSVMLIAFVLLLYRQAISLNAMLLGESEAHHLGVPVEALKRRLILVTALGVGVCTAMVGTIAFVGLIVPHLVRLISGPDHRTLLPASGLLGGVLLMLADSLARVVIAPAELPVGVITALLGVPFFILLLRQHSFVNVRD
ncbi:MAG: iron ABC transporter permease [Arenicellaceae bacterium]|nr:iron ABC transporter permease [Arenicellaceae bacterium]